MNPKLDTLTLIEANLTEAIDGIVDALKLVPELTAAMATVLGELVEARALVAVEITRAIEEVTI